MYRYYDSRRRIFNDSRPERIKIKEQNDRKTKIRARQKLVHTISNFMIFYCAMIQLYNRRMKLCSEKELKRWQQISEHYMTEESDNEEGGFSMHKPRWRSNSNGIIKLYVCTIFTNKQSFKVNFNMW